MMSPLLRKGRPIYVGSVIIGYECDQTSSSGSDDPSEEVPGSDKNARAVDNVKVRERHPQRHVNGAKGDASKVRMETKGVPCKINGNRESSSCEVQGQGRKQSFESSPSSREMILAKRQNVINKFKSKIKSGLAEVNKKGQGPHQPPRDSKEVPGSRKMGANVKPSVVLIKNYEFCNTCGSENTSGEKLRTFVELDLEEFGRKRFSCQTCSQRFDTSDMLRHKTTCFLTYGEVYFGGGGGDDVDEEPEMVNSNERFRMMICSKCANLAKRV